MASRRSAVSVTLPPEASASPRAWSMTFRGSSNPGGRSTVTSMPRWLAMRTAADGTASGNASG